MVTAKDLVCFKVLLRSENSMRVPEDELIVELEGTVFDHFFKNFIKFTTLAVMPLYIAIGLFLGGIKV